MSSDLLENYSETVEMKEPHEKDLSKAKELKEKGNICFKEEDTNQALELYEQAIDYCPKEELDLLTVLFSNMSIVYFKHVHFNFNLI